MERASLGMLTGIRSLRAALAMLRSERSLWPWCLSPLLVNLLTFGAAFVAFWIYWEPAADWLRERLATGDPESWYAWLWVGPLRLLAWLVRWLLLATLLVAVYLVFTALGGVIAAPFLEVLSRKVEELQSGRVLEDETPALRAWLRAVLEEGKRTLWFLALWGGLLVLGWIPGLQVPVLLAGTLLTLLFLPLDYPGHCLDRRGVGFRERRRWVWRHRNVMVGFGTAAFGTFFLPGLNFLCLPWLVTAGTLLALRVGPPARAGSGETLA